MRVLDFRCGFVGLDAQNYDHVADGVAIVHDKYRTKLSLREALGTVKQFVQEHPRCVLCAVQPPRGRWTPAVLRLFVLRRRISVSLSPTGEQPITHASLPPHRNTCINATPAAVEAQL